jgi:hypothetical protein
MLLRPAAGGPGQGPGPGGWGGLRIPNADAGGDGGAAAVVVEAAADAGRFLLRRVLAPGALGGA